MGEGASDKLAGPAEPLAPVVVTKKRPWVQFYLSTLVAVCIVLSLFVPACMSFCERAEPLAVPAPALPATTYGLGALGALLVVAWRARSLGLSIFIWLCLSIPIGMVGCFVPFGDACVNTNGAPPTGFMGFCGEGMPIPSVIWDKGADYPNPMNFIMNPCCVCLVGTVILLLWHALAGIGRLALRRIRRKGAVQ